MVRSKVDACIFCGEAPCVCGKPAKAPVKPRKTERVVVEGPVVLPSPEPVVQKVSAFAAMKAAALAAPPPPPPEPVKVKAPPRSEVVNVAEAQFAAAIRAVGDMLREDEQEKYRHILTSTPTAAENLAVWKARQNEQA